MRADSHSRQVDRQATDRGFGSRAQYPKSESNSFIKTANNFYLSTQPQSTYVLFTPMVCGGRAAGVEIGPTAEQAGTSANEGLPKRTAAGLFYLITAK